MRGWSFRCGTLLACVLMLMLASCASAPMQPGPQASSLAVMADDQPFSLIFYRHPGTASGGGALPTAEVAVVLALAALEEQPDGSSFLPMDRTEAVRRHLMISDMKP